MTSRLIVVWDGLEIRFECCLSRQVMVDTSCNDEVHYPPSTTMRLAFLSDAN